MMSLSLSASKYLLAPALGWMVAQGIKYMLGLGRDGLQWSDFIASGGMPSSHTSMSSALAFTIGIADGFQTPLFALAVLLTAIIMYDATGVRRSSGEQGAVLEKVISREKEYRKLPLHIAKGHTPVQVAVGLVIGLVIGLFVGKF